MLMIRRRWTLVPCLGVMFLIAGCVSTPVASRTGGMKLKLGIEESGNMAAYYTVGTDGTIGFGGGLDARFERIAWTGSMQDEEVAKLLLLIEQHQLYDRKPVGTGEPKNLRWRFELSGPGGWNRSRLTGECPILREMYEILKTSSRRRFDGIIDDLPKPGERGNN